MRNPLVLCFLLAAPALAADKPSRQPFVYQKAPQIIHEVLSLRPTPQVVISPARDRLLVIETLRYPPISDLAAPMLRLAGLRIDPATNGLHHPPRHTGLLVVEIADGKERRVALPDGAWIGAEEWSPDGRRFAFLNYTPHSIELWVGDATSAAARKLAGIAVNGSLMERPTETNPGRYRPLVWMADSQTLLVQTVPGARGKPPVAAAVPDGPHVQESAGKVAPIPTYEDLLQNRHDEELFDYYCTAQLARVNTQTGRATPVGKPAIFDSVEPSPDREHVLIVRLHKPYSNLLPAWQFPKTVEVWNRDGRVEYQLADLPSHEGVPLEGVLTGPRSYRWRPTAPATLVWAEALDGGNTRANVPFHDRVMTLAAPFRTAPVELVKMQYRLQWRGAYAHAGGHGFLPELMFGDGFALATEYDRNRRWTRTTLFDPDRPGAPGRIIFDRSVHDRYGDPGVPLLRQLPNGKMVVAENGDSIFLVGDGASPQGDFPFLARFDLKSLKSERVFQAIGGTYETVESLLSDDGSRFLTRFETPDDPPNLYLRHASGGEKTAVTHFPDPAPQLRGIKKQIVRYKRNDGVDLSFALYLPPDYKPGTRLPTILWAYPLEYSDASTAGQVSGSQYRFTALSTATRFSEILLVTQGYALLDNATMPVIGDPDTMNNTYVEQIVAGARAAIDKAVEMGVTDRDRVGVGGHSYGAFMTANLLAHSELFRAGVARSGAYNRTLTPFGFQSERRTFWQAKDIYLKVSPFAFADEIRQPILLIHGDADDNSGTFPIQSERMYQAIKGNGGVVRYVTLPYEAHVYQALESVEYVQWEMVNWFDRWVKNTPTNQGAAAR